MNECPCKDCTRRSSRCHGKCEEYAEWKLETERQNREQRPPQTKGFWDWKAARLTESIKQRNRNRVGRRGGGTGET